MLLVFIYNCSDQVLATRERRQAKSRLWVLVLLFMQVAFTRSLDKAASALEMELTAARTSQTGGQHLWQHASNYSLQQAFLVIEINAAFSSKKRRDCIRETWLPKGNQLKELVEREGHRYKVHDRA